jgi:hypothetical protein
MVGGTVNLCKFKVVFWILENKTVASAKSCYKCDDTNPSCGRQEGFVLFLELGYNAIFPSVS